MRKLLLLLTLLSYSIIHAQVSDADAALAKQLVAKNSGAIGLSADDLNNIIVSSTYVSDENIRMVYLYQAYKGIPVYNQMHVLAFKNDKLVSVSGVRIPFLEQKVNVPTGTPSVVMQQAVKAAFTESKINLADIKGSLDAPVKNARGKFDFGKLGVASAHVTAELMWVPADEKKIKLAWQILVAPAATSDMWLIRVDAINNEIISKNNLTIYCSWHKEDHRACDNLNETSQADNYVVAKKQTPLFNNLVQTPLINSATYRVVKYPAESPIHPGGAPSLHTDPWTMAPGNATSLKWHNDGSADYNITRGNNVWAKEDLAANNSTSGQTATSATPDPLTFDFIPDFTIDPRQRIPVQNQQFNITNLFYWNNIMHDISYLYGFNEAAGNFQMDNQGRGGIGNDYVIADAQDGNFTGINVNNANFNTPDDGVNPRMQMYLWSGAPLKDGDVDNGIIAHEFGHGISNRLTGGPANSSCVSNAEHGGEGWSDYYALMLTTNWATATVNDGTLRRTIGTYASGHSVSGSGIRSFPYSTNLVISPLVYSSILPTAVHSRGEYWCSVLWEMTWEMIQLTGINPNLFNPNGVGGNSASIKLVTEGMKLQPCGPGFIDARDAILKADTLFFGGQYSCAIWKAFAKRGMGRGASQGSPNSVTDQVPSFLPNSATVTLTQSAPTVTEGQNVTYFNTIKADNCGNINGYFLTDTLPANVTYVSGGSYNAANRTVTFSPISMTGGSTQILSFTVTVNNATYFAPQTHLNETVASTALPASWDTTSNTPPSKWRISSVFSNSSPNAFFAKDTSAVADFHLVTTAAITLPTGNSSNFASLSFWHRFDTEDGWDGGVVEISTNGGANWSDLGSKMISGKYNGELGTGSNNPIGGRAAFTGRITAFMKTVVNLSSYAGQAIKIRFRFASDDNTAPIGGGWFVDDIVLSSEPGVFIQSNLFNASSVLQSSSYILTKILENLACVPLSVTTQPANANTCTGGNATLTIAATGTSPVYQWQVNTGSGFANVPAAAPYSGTTTNTLTITGITAAMSTYLYRVVLSNGCTAPFNSNSAGLVVGTTATLNSHPAAVSVCTGTTTSFSVTATNAASYQWQVNTGSGFVNITNTAPYSGATTATLTITGVTAAMNSFQYRCLVGSCPTAITSNAATLTVFSFVAITTQPLSTAAVCQNGSITFNVLATGTINGYQWQVSTDGGNIFNNIPGATTATLSLTNVSLTQNANRYRVVITGNCNTLNSTTVLLTVNATPSFTIGTIPSAACVSDTAINLTASLAGGIWSGNGIQGSQFVPSLAGLGTAVITYTFTNILGCTFAQSATIQVNGCPERHIGLNQKNSIIVYPNPGNGKFSLRIKSDLYKKLGMRVYANDGKLVKVQQLTGIMYDRIVPVDLSWLPNGLYQLFLYNDETGSLIKRTIGIVISR